MYCSSSSWFINSPSLPPPLLSDLLVYTSYTHSLPVFSYFCHCICVLYFVILTWLSGLCSISIRCTWRLHHGNAWIGVFLTFSPSFFLSSFISVAGNESGIEKPCYSFPGTDNDHPAGEEKKKKTGYRHGEAYKSLCPEKGGKDRLKNHSTHQQKNELTNNKMKMKKRRKKRTTIQGTKGLTRQQPSISIWYWMIRWLSSQGMAHGWMHIALHCICKRESCIDRCFISICMYVCMLCRIDILHYATLYYTILFYCIWLGPVGNKPHHSQP